MPGTTGDITGDQEQAFSEAERNYVPPEPGQPQPHVVRPYRGEGNEEKTDEQKRAEKATAERQAEKK